jgi:hypothetical protein
VNYIVTPGQVRAYLELNEPGSSSRYSDETIGSNIRAAQSDLETVCRRFFYDHPALTWATTTMLQAQVALPGFRTITSCTWGGAVMSVALPGDGNTSPSAWGLWEAAPGVDQRLIIGMQFRAWRVDNDMPWYFADKLWWDKSLDNPFYPGNYGGGYAWTSMPNDLVIVGDGGYTAGSEPEAVKDVVKVFAAWKTIRPAGLLGGIGITPGGGSVDYSILPAEVRDFIADWTIGQQVASM